MTATGGKRAGTRKGAKSKTHFRPVSLLLAVGITIAVIAWGYLVYLAILHGQDMRAGDKNAWQLVLATGAGAVLALFTGFMLIARLMRVSGITKAAVPPPEVPAAPGGGRRIRPNS